jgi:hypothetical protein
MSYTNLDAIVEHTVGKFFQSGEPMVDLELLIVEQLIDDTFTTHPQIFDDSILYHGPLIPADIRDQT